VQNITTIVDKAYEIGMMQIREEIMMAAHHVFALRPRHLLEIGTAGGGTFYVWCACAAPGGIRISLDLPGGPYGGREYADSFKLSDRNKVIRSWAPDAILLPLNSHTRAAVKAVEDSLRGEELDLLIIDGDHSYNGVTKDFTLYSPFMRQGGCILFHDINDTLYHRSRGVRVGQLWCELRGNKSEFNAHLKWGGWGVLLMD